MRQLESFAVTFAQIIDHAPYITGPVIYLLDGREEKPVTAVIEVDKPDQYDTNSIKWSVNGVDINGIGEFGEIIILTCDTPINYIVFVGSAG